MAKPFLNLHRSPASITYSVNLIIVPFILFGLSSSVDMTGMPALHDFMYLYRFHSMPLYKDEQNHLFISLRAEKFSCDLNPSALLCLFLHSFSSQFSDMMNKTEENNCNGQYNNGTLFTDACLFFRHPNILYQNFPQKKN